MRGRMRFRKLRMFVSAHRARLQTRLASMIEIKRGWRSGAWSPAVERFSLPEFWEGEGARPILKKVEQMDEKEGQFLRRRRTQVRKRQRRGKIENSENRNMPASSSLQDSRPRVRGRVPALLPSITCAFAHMPHRGGIISCEACVKKY